MCIRVVCAVLNFNTPSGNLKKVVNWSYYEEKALLSSSTTSEEAIDKFLLHGRRIIRASIINLRHLESICFFEEIRDNGNVTRLWETETETVLIIKKNNEIMRFEMTLE